jgi:actin related protein 2/3 complex subunit 5
MHNTADTRAYRSYKGMSSHGSSGSTKGVSPQPTGFSQMGGRAFGGGEGGGQMMSVLLSWHEKVVEIAGTGCIARVMTDRRTA